MTDVQAAIGREQLRKLPSIVERRRQIAADYAERLGHIGGLGVPAEPEWCRTNWQSYCVALPHGTDQRAVMQALLDVGISTRRGIMNSHLEPAYQHPGAYRQGSTLQHSAAAQSGSIILPLFTQMTEVEIARVADALEQILGAVNSAAA
jgi:dTDP-4-amino-4,6-dideoxygalactose transaminase